MCMQDDPVLHNRLGESITDPQISMFDDPLIKKASASMRWDAEGTPTHRVDFIREGITQNLCI